jgi:hypothetical protein
MQERTRARGKGIRQHGKREAEIETRERQQKKKNKRCRQKKDKELSNHACLFRPRMLELGATHYRLSTSFTPRRRLRGKEPTQNLLLQAQQEAARPKMSRMSGRQRQPERPPGAIEPNRTPPARVRRPMYVHTRTAPKCSDSADCADCNRPAHRNHAASRKWCGPAGLLTQINACIPSCPRRARAICKKCWGPRPRAKHRGAKIKKEEEKGRSNNTGKGHQKTNVDEKRKS